MSRCIPCCCASATGRRSRSATRSEEHTSELQLPCNLVCRLLLENNKLNMVFVDDLPAHAIQQSAVALRRLTAVDILFGDYFFFFHDGAVVDFPVASTVLAAHCHP